jgi:CheY-like chemotaxis protein
MAAVYGIIRNHGGWIKVDSELGRGARIIVYFPSVDDAPLQDKSSGTPVALGTETILLVEDDDVVLDISQKILTRLGYQTLVAKTGEEAIKIFKKADEKFDLVLLDMKLPDIDGKIVFSALKETRPDTKVIVFSGYSLDGPVQEILDAGADGFVQKPFSLSTLSTQIREVL